MAEERATPHATSIGQAYASAATMICHACMHISLQREYKIDHACMHAYASAGTMGTCFVLSARVSAASIVGTLAESVHAFTREVKEVGQPSANMDLFIYLERHSLIKQFWPLILVKYLISLLVQAQERKIHISLVHLKHMDLEHTDQKKF